MKPDPFFDRVLWLLKVEAFVLIALAAVVAIAVALGPAH